MLTHGLTIRIEGAPRTGEENMERDAADLAAVAAGGSATLRWYRWDAPTISLGHFQRDSGDDFPALPRVRRISGGGAILHDREWTYALALPSTHRLTARPGELYRLVHESIISALVEAGGPPLRLRGTAETDRDGAFLCFLRGDANDVLRSDGEDRSKVIGSAQRRPRGGLLQHGSVLWTASPLLPELRGVADGTDLPAIDEAIPLLQSLSRAIAWQLADPPRSRSLDDVAFSQPS